MTPLRRYGRNFFAEYERHVWFTASISWIDVMG